MSVHSVNGRCSSIRRSSTASPSRGRADARSARRSSARPSRPTRWRCSASLLRNAGMDVRLIDATASRTHDRRGHRAGSTPNGFAPTLIVFPTTTPTLDADVRRSRSSKKRYGAPMFCFGPHASTAPAESMAARRGGRRRRHVRRRTGGRRSLQLASLASLDALGEVPSLTWRRNGDASCRTAPTASFSRLPRRLPFPAWDLLDLKRLLAAAGRSPVRDRRNQPRLPVHLRLLRRADPSGPQVPRTQREGAGRRDRARLSRARHRVLLPVGRHRHAERQVVHGVLRRAHRPPAADSMVRQRPRRQPDRSRRSSTGSSAPAAGCSRSASSPSRTRSARTW